MLAEDLVADGVQQVGLAEPDRTVEEERVVAVRGALGDGARGGVGELVRAADDEGVEGVLRVESLDRPHRDRGLALVEAVVGGEKDLEQLVGDGGGLAVDQVPVALLDGVDEAGVRRDQDELVGASRS